MTIDVPRWSRLRAIGNSGPVKLTILIPLVGYFVIFNSQLAQYLELVSEIGGFTAHQFSVSPRLLLIYFGLCAFAVGSAVYSIFCPDEVKHYGISAAYVGGDGPNIKDFAFEPMEDELRHSSYIDEYKRIRSRYENLGGVTTEKQFEETKLQINNGVLHLYFRYKDNSYLLMRLIAFVCYVVGFVCLLIPSIGVFFRVVRILWNVLMTVPFSVL
jgi:hypothetical protein